MQVTATACSASAPTPTSTSSTEPPYVPKSPSEILRIDNSCPSSIISSSDVGSPTTDRYNCQEDTDFGNNDIMWFTAYTLQACIDACSSYNVGNKTNTPCKGVALAEDLSHQYNVNGGANCWLKLGVEKDGFSKSPTVTLAWLVEA
ncbi:hypothetical protein SLS60_010541 [Paraconiothyrium brasiliense]|uniref:Apple domain-containing protein n=1 Tax=Paraconiothyrium brasiliense TaxID=300254 RepID=A0ABR3QNS8_9PLEO